jgi:hypothetical protein
MARLPACKTGHEPWMWLDVAAFPPKKGSFMHRFWVCCLAVPSALWASQARAEDPQGERALLDDVARVVAAEEVDDWFADREALREVEANLLPSVCNASPDARQAALDRLRRGHEAAGDPRALYQVRGEVTDEVERALTAERRLRALEAALARQAECPFWIRPRPAFQGLQSDRRRLTLSVESGGNVQFRYTRQHLTFGAGGSGRLLIGWGFDGRYTLLFGPELGGSALLKPDSNASEFVINYFPAAPIVFRVRQLTWHWEAEVSPVALFEAGNTRLSWGGRVGGAFAFTALRRRNVLPWAGLAVSYEYYLEGGGREPTHFLRGGVRIGLPWDP